MRDAGLLLAAMIDHRNAERFEPARDRLADAAEPDDAGLAAAQRGREAIIALRGPVAGPQIALRLGQFPHRAEQQAERGIGDLLVEHVRGIGDDDAVLARPFGIDMVVADPEARDHFELGEFRHRVGVDEVVKAAAGRHGAQTRGKLGDQPVTVRRFPQLVQRECLGNAIDDHRRQRTHHQYVGLFGGHRQISM